MAPRLLYVGSNASDSVLASEMPLIAPRLFSAYGGTRRSSGNTGRPLKSERIAPASSLSPVGRQVEGNPPILLLAPSAYSSPRLHGGDDDGRFV